MTKIEQRKNTEHLIKFYRGYMIAEKKDGNTILASEYKHKILGVVSLALDLNVISPNEYTTIMSNIIDEYYGIMAVMK